MSTFASAVPTGFALPASWRWMTSLAAAMAIGVTAASWQPSEPIRPAGKSTAAPAAASPSLVALAERDPSRPVTVIVQLGAGADAQALVGIAGGTVLRELGIINAISARVSAAGAIRLATEPGVRHVSLDAAVAPSSELIAEDDDALGTVDDEDGSATYSATVMGDDTSGRRVTGKGVTVAVVDTGIAGDLPDLKGADGRSRVVASVTVHPDAKTAGDTIGHGTHIAGLIAGNGAKRNGALRGRYLGVAPEAELVSVKVSDDQGSITVADVISGLQAVVELKDQLSIDVANVSLNSSVAESPATDPLAAAAEVVWRNGVTVVAAAGNRGSAPDAVGYGPGNDPFVITVGALDDQGTRPMRDDLVPAWSSRGVTQTGVAKPEIAAPGSRLISLLAPGSLYAQQCPECVVDGAYLRLGGTSMAAGVVSGAVAALLQRHPDWSPDQIKGALMAGAKVVDSQPSVKLNRTLALDGRHVANGAAVPSTLLPSTGEYPSLAEWTRMSLSRMSLSRMSLSAIGSGDPRYASWSRMSLSCVCRPTDAEIAQELQAAEADPTRMSLSRMSLSRMSLSRMSLSTSFTK